MHLNRYISFWAQRLDGRPAVVFGDESISWAEFERASASLAAALEQSGLKPGDRFGCLLNNCIEWCVAFAASIRLGAVFVPLNPMFGAFELRQIFDDADCAAVLSCPSHIGKIDAAYAQEGAPEVPRLYLFGGRRRPSVAYAEIIAQARPWRDRRFADGDLLIICYTSGTTGVPKGVMLSHRAVETAALGIVLSCGLRGGEERLLILAPLAFTGGVISNLCLLILIGGTGWLERGVDPERALKLLVDQRISSMGGVPALWERVAGAPGFEAADISSLKMAVTGGAPVPRALLDAYIAKGVAIRQQYGFTEGCGGVATYDAEGAVANPEGCGFPLPAMDLEIRDDSGARLAAGQVGEIFARGEQLMSGYWRKPDETAAAMADGWYATGDLGTYAEDGALKVVDRKKCMLISGGVNIYPAEVERALHQIEGVRECVVFGLESAKWGQKVAAIVHAPGCEGAAIMSAARALLGSYKAPKHLVLSPDPLPKTASNKIARTGLVELFDALATGAGATIVPAH